VGPKREIAHLWRPQPVQDANRSLYNVAPDGVNDRAGELALGMPSSEIEKSKQRLLAVRRKARNTWLVHFVALAIETGMRRSELLGLQWSNVNLDQRIALLPLTKNGESRAVPL